MCERDSKHVTVQPQSLTADNYMQAFANIQQGVLTLPDCAVVRAMLRSSDADKLRNGLQLVLKLSITTQKNKVAKYNSFIVRELICQVFSLFHLCLLVAKVINLITTDCLYDKRALVTSSSN